jgi:hypothetical protein
MPSARAGGTAHLTVPAGSLSCTGAGAPPDSCTTITLDSLDGGQPAPAGQTVPQAGSTLACTQGTQDMSGDVKFCCN